MAKRKTKAVAAKPAEKPAMVAPARAAAPTPAGRSKPIKVRATRLGYYDDERKRVGDVFIIKSAREFSENWMETVDGSVPVKTTGPQESLNRETHRITQQKAGAEGLQGQGSDEARAQAGESPLGD